MDDDVIGLISWLIVIAAIGYAAYLFIVYVVPWVLLVGATVGLPGWALSHLLVSQRVQLTRKSALCLFLVNGALAWCVATALISELWLPDPLAVLAGASLFFIGGFLLVAGWALARWASVQILTADQNGGETAASRTLAEVKGRIAELEQKVLVVTECSQKRLSEQTALQTAIAELCAQEPRLLGAVRQSWSSRLRDATTEEVRGLLTSHEADGASPATRIAVALMKLELVCRESQIAGKNLQRLEEQLATSRRQMDEAATKLQEARQAQERAQEARRAFLRNPILL